MHLVMHLKWMLLRYILATRSHFCITCSRKYMSKMIVSDNVSLTLISDICVSQHLSYQASFLEDLHPHLRVDQMLLREEHMYPDAAYTVLSYLRCYPQRVRGDNVGNPIVLDQWYCPMGCTNFFHSTSLTLASLTWLVPNIFSHLFPLLMTITKCSN